MTISESLEVETKFEVGPGTPVPAPESVAPLTADRPVRHELSAVYHDTADLALTRHKVTLRRRTGGPDAGWHLKLPARAGRVELHSPLADDVPAELVAAVAGLVRRRPLQPIARVDNDRRVTLLRDPEGVAAVEFCDDHVSTRSLLPGGSASRWREWEVELVDPTRPDAADLLTTVAAACVDAGAETSSSSSKLARAVGPLPARLPGGAAAGPDPRGTSPVLDALVADLDQVLDNDPAARRVTVTGVHQMRVAVRGLRSTLGSYGDELAGPAARSGVDPEAVSAELKSLAAVLGGVRDVQVVRQRLDALAEEYPEEVVDAATRRRLRVELEAAERRAGERLVEALASDRYLDLLDRLHQLVDAVAADAVGAEARAGVGVGRGDAEGARDGGARGGIPHTVLGGVDRQFRRFSKARARAEKVLADPDLPLSRREESTHLVRKRAKALRRNVGALPEDTGLTVEPLRAACQRLHTVLGDVQDSVTARRWIRRIARRAQAAGESTFGLGVLYERERAFSEQALAGFPEYVTAVAAAYRALARSRRTAGSGGKGKKNKKKSGRKGRRKKKS